MNEDKDSCLDERQRALSERGSRLPPDLLRLTSAVLGVTDDATSHRECIELLPEYVDAEAAGEQIAVNYPRMKQHLDLCDDCSEQYAALLDLMLAERSGQIPFR